MERELSPELGCDDEFDMLGNPGRPPTFFPPPQLLRDDHRTFNSIEASRRRAARRMPPPPGFGSSTQDSDTEPDTATPNADDTKEVTEAAEKLVIIDEKDIGMKSGLKHLYSGKEDKHGRFQWSKEMPKDLGQPAEDAESAQWAIIARHVKVYGDPRRVLSLHSIIIQSPLIKELLGKVLAGYPGVTVNLERLEFSGRCEPLIHRWDKLSEVIDEIEQGEPSGDEKREDSAALLHAKLLYNLLYDEFAETIKSAQDMTRKGAITYALLWTAFPPGTLVYTKVQGQDRVFRLHGSMYGRDRNDTPVFWLTCQYIDFDGTRFGTVKINFKIPTYEGVKQFQNLAALPLTYAADKANIKTKLIERGGRVQDLTASHYRAYNGVGWRINNEGRTENHTVKGRIMVDTVGWNRYNPNQPVFVTPLHRKDPATAAGFSTGGTDSAADPFHFDPYGGDAQQDADEDCGIPPDGLIHEEFEEEAAPKLNDEQKLICAPTVRGYALKEKTWLNFFVNTITEVSFNDKAFDALVLPEDQKELILGFTSTQQDYRNSFDDVIEGKGRGIVLLLCGPPGVGKTLTAESVAEEMKVPLYILSSGDLGIDPRHAEVKLNGILNMCTRWNAILLIDEADVFLEERSLHELERNKLVSVFLRVLEYYEGIMFLTTNRVQTFDPAFQSRIHISIDYPELSAESRRTVWDNFLRQHDLSQAGTRDKAPKGVDDVGGTAAERHLRRTMPHAMTERDLEGLSLLPLNGRQIKNILKTAQLLASRRQQPLSKQHVSVVMGVTQHLHTTSMQSESARRSIFN